MLKHRIIPTLLYRDGSLVKGKQFNSWRRTGPVIPAVKVHDMRNVDELIFLDIGATPGAGGADVDLIADISEECYMPLTVGGGVSTLEHFRQLLAVGADKIALSTAAVENPSLIEAAATRFGRQCVVVSIDIREGRVATGCGSITHDLSPLDWAKECERRGAGEILLNSIDNDGMMQGYDVNTLQAICHALSVPVVPLGGAGEYKHLAQALNAGSHGVAAGAMFQFTEQTPKGAAEYLHEKGYPIRRSIMLA